MEKQSWILHHDNAPAHTWMLVRGFLAKNKTVIHQPPYSSDLASVDFFLFAKLKTPMKRKRFATIEKIKKKSKQKLLAIPKSSFQKRFEGWKNAGISVLYLTRGYFGGDRIVIAK